MSRALSLHAGPRGEGGRTLDGAEGALATAVGRVAADRLRHTIRNTGSNHKGVSLSIQGHQPKTRVILGNLVYLTRNNASACGSSNEIRSNCIATENLSNAMFWEVQ